MNDPVLDLTGNPYLAEVYPRLLADRAARSQLQVAQYFHGDYDAVDSLKRRIEFDRSMVANRSSRYDLVTKYAWAIPTPAVLQKIAEYSPIVEFGAGTGYWAYLLRNRDVDVVAIDRDPPGAGIEKNVYHRYQAMWTSVERGSYRRLRAESHRSLFLCWPPERTSMALRATLAYQGDTILYLGEGRDGCNGSTAFHDELAAAWTQIDDEAVLQWEDVHDHLWVYRRAS